MNLFQMQSEKDQLSAGSVQQKAARTHTLCPAY